MMQTIKILVAGENIMLRNGICSMLNNQEVFIPEIYAVKSGAELLDKAEKEQFDLLLVDVQMHKIDGISAIRKLKEKGRTLPILAISTSQNLQLIQYAMTCGVIGFISKDTGVEELTKAIQTVCKGQKYYSNEIAQTMLGTKRKKVKNSDVLNLTKREREILVLLTEELTTEEIAEALDISKRTVEGHRTNLKIKLQVKSTVGLVKFAIESGHFGG